MSFSDTFSALKRLGPGPADCRPEDKEMGTQDIKWKKEDSTTEANS